jgi:hypothetical protein
MSGAILPLPQYLSMAWCSVEAQGQLYLYLISYKISSFLLWPNKVHSAVRLVNFISVYYSLLTYLCFSAQFSQPHICDGVAKILYTFKRECFWTKLSFRTRFRIPKLINIYLISKLHPSPILTEFFIPIF